MRDRINWRRVNHVALFCSTDLAVFAVLDENWDELLPWVLVAFYQARIVFGGRDA